MSLWLHPCLFLTSSSEKKTFPPAKSSSVLPLDDLQFQCCDEMLTRPFFPSSEIQTEGSGVHPSPERTGNFVTDQSYRVSHCRVVWSLYSVECPGPGYIRFRGKSLAFQTPGDADADTNHHHPPFISTLRPNITQKAMWRWRKVESIDCSAWQTHERSLVEEKHIFLVLAQLHHLIHECFSLPLWRGYYCRCYWRRHDVTTDKNYFTQYCSVMWGIPAYNKPEPAAVDIDPVPFSQLQWKINILMRVTQWCCFVSV